MYEFQKPHHGLLRRIFTMEQLERRSMLASDVARFHNITMPEDADGSGDVTPLDALVVINRLNSVVNSTATTAATMTDVDADATTSPLDALLVINYLNREQNGAAAVSSLSSATRIAQIEKLILVWLRGMQKK